MNLRSIFARPFRSRVETAPDPVPVTEAVPASAPMPVPDPAPVAQPVLRQAVPHLFEAIPERQETFSALFGEYDAHHGEPHDPIRVLQFMYNIDIANRAEPGDYLELGTHRGLTARLIYKLMDQSRTLYLLDTYEGFKEADLVVERNIYANPWHEGNFIPTSPEYVASYVGGGTPPDNVKPIKGWFPQSESWHRQSVSSDREEVVKGHTRERR